MKILVFEKAQSYDLNLLCFESKVSAQSLTLRSLIPNLVAIGRAWGRSQGATLDNHAGLEPQMCQFLLTRRSRIKPPFGQGWVRRNRVQDHHGPQQRNAGEGERVEESGWCYLHGIILNEAVGSISK